MTRPLIRAWNPSASEESAFRATDASFDWLCNLPVDVLRQYHGKWIAIRDSSVIAAADSLDFLLRELGDTDLQTVILDRIERPGWMVYR